MEDSKESQVRPHDVPTELAFNGISGDNNEMRRSAQNRKHPSDRRY